MFLGRSCAGIMADIFFFLLVIAVSFIHYWYSFFSVSACFRFLSADFQSDLLQHRKTLTHTHPPTFPLHGLLSVSPPRVFQSSSSFWLWDHDVGKRFFRLSFFFISRLSLTDLPHFLPFPSMALLPLSSFKTIPPSPPFAFFCSRFSSVLLFFSSLSSFICLSSSLVRLQRVLKSWGHQETSSAAHFFPPTIPLLFSLHSAFFFIAVARSYLFTSSLFSQSRPFLFGLFFYWEFLWLLPLFFSYLFHFLSCCWRLTYSVMLFKFFWMPCCSGLFIACSSWSFDWSSCSFLHFSTAIIFFIPIALNSRTSHILGCDWHFLWLLIHLPTTFTIFCL